jgi:hypothetical protein
MYLINSYRLQTGLSNSNLIISFILVNILLGVVYLHPAKASLLRDKVGQKNNLRIAAYNFLFLANVLLIF